MCSTSAWKRVGKQNLYFPDFPLKSNFPKIPTSSSKVPSTSGDIAFQVPPGGQNGTMYENVVHEDGCWKKIVSICQLIKKLYANTGDPPVSSTMQNLNE